MKKTRTTSDLLALVVFAVFAVCVLGVLLFGAGVYRNLVHSATENHNSRTAAQYITTKVRQAETVSLVDFGGCQALAIPETIDGDRYITRIYHNDGMIRELFSSETANLSPEDGEKILDAASLSFDLQGYVLQVTIGSQSLYLHVPGAKEGTP